MNKPPTRASRVKPSRETKGKTALTEKQPATLLEIVPGKFNENDWTNMIEIEDSQEYVWELIDEVFDNVIKIIYDKYIKKQTIPYTINEARKAILHIIEWQFLSKDVDDDLVENWSQDQEPEECVLDSWAQGCVQTISINVDAETLNKKEEVNELKEDKTNSLNFLEELNQIVDNDENKQYETDLKNALHLGLSDRNSQMSKRNSSLDKAIKEKIKASKDKIELNRQKRRQLESIARKKLLISQDEAPTIARENTQAKSLNDAAKRLNDQEPVSKAPIQCQSVLKSLLNRPVALRELELDQNGQVQSITKVDFDKLPMNNIKVRFNVLSENKNNSTVDQFRKNRTIVTNINLTEEMFSSGDLKVKMPNKNTFRKSPPRRRSRSNIIDEEDEALVEPTSGVIFSVSNSTRVGPKKSNVSLKHQIMFEKSESLLKPVRQFDSETTNLTRSSIEEILSNTAATLKGPMKLKPIPPINTSTRVN